MVPTPLQEPVGELLRTTGDPSPIRHARSVGGGCINNAIYLQTDQHAYLLKWNPRPLPRMFLVEAEGLKLMQATRTVRVPTVVGASDATDTHPAFIVMEWLEGGGRRFDTGELGEQLAEMHRTGVSPKTPPAYGLDHDNYIGSTPQYNGWEEDWVTFYHEKRLLPQIELAQRNGYMNSRRRDWYDRLVERLHRLLGKVPRQPALLHGDLWGGNVMTGPEGVPALIDPAVYYGDREAEIAFTELFGGFGRRFYDAYHATWPLDHGYAERKDLYNLYHLLNHLNLFGTSYASQVDAVLRKYAV